MASEHPLLANEKAVMLQVFSIVTRKDERDVYELYFSEDFDLEAPVEEPEVSASEATADFEAEEVTEEPETAEDSFEEVSSEEADTDEQ